ncbi:hypothetical protein CHS0354_011203 [Potamilus streckersoni]|uniref:EF-hand domain-containing protein n=1 Tax=Potamilus streckersoni TaxID=2493646 RepID=A0AAE0W607_9BIVA|nr:hypothetical protein CHS0354_011203 [Potamilus streckersoni]
MPGVNRLRQWNRSMRRTRETELQRLRELRQELEETVKPVFDKHGNMGVSVLELRDQLEETGITQTIPKKRLELLLERADVDGNSYITYQEFTDMMTNPEFLSRKERTAMNKLIGLAIHNIVPRSLRQDFLKAYTCSPPPIFIPIISAVQIIVFVIYAIELSNRGTPVRANSGTPFYSPLVYEPSRRYQAWRFVTYSLIHDGYIHLINNLVIHVIFGLPLEIVHKGLRVMAIYFIGITAGSLAHSLTDQWALLVGASGGCYALIGGHLASVIVNWKEMNHECKGGNPFRFFLSAPMRFIIILFIVGGDTGYAIYKRYTDPDGEKIGVAAHIGGLLAGLLVGVPFLKNLIELPWERTVGVVTLTVFMLFVVTAVIFNGVYNGYPPTDWS